MSDLEIPELEPLVVDELAEMKRKADKLGIKYSNNIGVDALRARIREHMEGKKEEEPVKKTADGPKDDQYELPLNEVTDEAILRERMYKENMFLVRVRISNLNPLKKDVPAEWFTVHNKYLGTIRKLIPFGEATDNGYHVPKIILDALKERKFNSIKTRKDPVTGHTIVDSQWVREFAIEELPYLTNEEMAQLARQQAAAKGM